MSHVLKMRKPTVRQNSSGQMLSLLAKSEAPIKKIGETTFRLFKRLQGEDFQNQEIGGTEDRSNQNISSLHSPQRTDN